MESQLKMIIGAILGIVIFFVMASSILIPFWNTTATTSYSGAGYTNSTTGTGLSQAGQQGLWILVILALIVGVIYGVFKLTKAE